MITLKQHSIEASVKRLYIQASWIIFLIVANIIKLDTRWIYIYGFMKREGGGYLLREGGGKLALGESWQ